MNKIDIYVFIALIISSLLVLPILSSASNTPNIIIVAGGVVQYSASVPSTPINKATLVYVNRANLTDAQTSFLADHFALLDLSWGLTQTTFESLKSKNPNVRIIGYKDLIGEYPNDDDDWATVNANESWFIHDVYGNRLVSSQFGWYLMDPASAGWRQHFVSYLNNKLSSVSQFDGIFADDVWDQLRNWYNPPFFTVPNSYIKSSDIARWHADTLGMLNYVKANLSPGKILLINTDEWATHDYLDVADGKMDEGFAHAAWQDFSTFDWRMPQDWQGNKLLDAIARDSATGKIVWCFSGTVIPSNPNATVLGQVTAVVKYCYAAFLCALNGTQTYLGFNSWDSNDGSQGYYPIMDTNIGQPKGAYYTSQNVFMRDFTSGKVLLNPSGNSSTVSLGGNYKLLNGTTVSSAVLTPWSGEILLSPT